MQKSKRSKKQKSKHSNILKSKYPHIQQSILSEVTAQVTTPIFKSFHGKTLNFQKPGFLFTDTGQKAIGILRMVKIIL